MAKSPFLEFIRAYMAVRKYSKRTVESYLYWIKYFIVFNGKQHPNNLGAEEVEVFLKHLTEERKVSMIRS